MDYPQDLHGLDEDPNLVDFDTQDIVNYNQNYYILAQQDNPNELFDLTQSNPIPLIILSDESDT